MLVGQPANIPVSLKMFFPNPMAHKQFTNQKKKRM